MRLRLYILPLFVSLVWAMVYINQTTLPNQQIVVQLSDSDRACHMATDGVELIKATLQSNGAKQLTVTKLENGELKITYFSSTEISDIQEALVDVLNLSIKIEEGLPDSGSSGDKTASDYTLRISELSTDIEGNWDFESIEVTTSNYKADRLLKVKHKFFGNLSSTELECTNQPKLRKGFNLSKNWNEALDYLIPEVRAGPLS